MRTILLATVAFAFVGANTAMSADVVVSSTVAKACEFTDEPDDIELSGNAIGGTGSASFEFECNFGPAGSPLSISFQSANGGMANPDDLGGPRDYDIQYEATTAFAASSAELAPVLRDDSSTGPGDTNTGSFTVTLTEALEVGGEYEDTLTVLLAP